MDRLLNDDLVRVIVSYTTPGVSLDVLTAFIPREVYRDATWRRKTLVESKGLIVDRSVMQMVGDGGWYAYYLSQNKTYCGDVLKVKVDARRRKIQTTSIVDHNTIYYEEINTERSDYITVVQYSDCTIFVDSMELRSINRKIRQVAYIESPFYVLLVLDEIGDVWLYNVANGVLAKNPIIVSNGVVAMHITDHDGQIEFGGDPIELPLLFLNRNGKLRFIGRKEYMVSPKVVSFLNISYAEMATLSDGQLIKISINTYTWRYAQGDYAYFFSLGPDELYLNGFITTKLKPSNRRYANDRGIVQIAIEDSLAAVLNTDRTAHIRIKSMVSIDTDYILPVEESIKRTQTVMLVQDFNSSPDYTRYFIIDPKPE